MEVTKISTNKPPVVAVSVYTFAGGQAAWAFTQMGFSRQTIAQPGQQFGFMLGTGSGRGFSIWPNWQRYATLTVHASQQQAQDFRQTNALATALQARSRQQTHYLLEPVLSHGAWAGSNPFMPLAQPLQPNEKVAVLTRATIRPTKLLDFWRHVPAVSQATAQAPGLQYQLGIGEWPVVQQATFSIWENEAAVQNFAYRMQDHKQVVSRTRQRRWYSEELFARFRILGNEVVK